MDIKYYDTPIPYATVHNFYNEQELSDIWKELDFLTSSGSFLPPELTATATTGPNATGKVLKQNKGVFLDNIYFKRDTSHILTHSKKIWNDDLLDFLANKNPFFKMLTLCNKDGCLLSYYENNDYYDWHNDAACFTFLVHLYREPKKFTGGDLILHPDKVIEIENNRLIVFPSFHKHSVTPVITDEKPNSGFGRYTITNFASINI